MFVLLTKVHGFVLIKYTTFVLNSILISRSKTIFTTAQRRPAWRGMQHCNIIFVSSVGRVDKSALLMVATSQDATILKVSTKFRSWNTIF